MRARASLGCSPKAKICMEKGAFETRCPRLGNQVPIAYCYQQPEGRPCARMLICWEWRLPKLRQVLSKLVPPEKWETYFETPPQPKALALVEEIRKAKAAGQGDGNSAGGEVNGP